MKELVFPRMFVPTVERQPDKVAVIGDYGGGYQATFAQHLDRVLRLKRGMAEGLGLNKDRRFAVLAGGSHRYLELWHAALFGGGIINPLNFRLSSPELEFILNDSGTPVIFVDSTYAPLVERLRRNTKIDKVVLLDDGDAEYDMRYEDLMSSQPAPPDEPEEDDVVVCMYTGGTTGTPKGVLLQHKAQVLTIYRMDFMYRHFTADDVFLFNTPMFHGAGVLGLMGIPAAGSTALIQPGFDPGKAIARAEEYGVTLMGLVPTMLAMILNHPDFAIEKFRALRGIAYGGSTMPEALMRRVLDAFPDIDLFQVYGMTETSAVLTALLTEDHRRGGKRLRSAGRALPGVRIQIRDLETKVPVESGQAGEIVAQSGGAMLGYWNRPEETASALRDGWYWTGDMGFLDDDGYLYITDRVKDMIITGGENVYPAEVESVLSTHAAVEQVAVIGVPSEAWGEEVHAIIVTRAGHDVTEQDIKAHAAEGLANYKVPKSVEFRTEPLPMSGAMKVLKRQLRASYQSSS